MNGTVDTGRSFGYFVYPFLFDLTAVGPATRDQPDPFRHLADLVGNATLEGKGLWQDWPIPAHDLMPHVAGFLNPGAPKPTGRFWCLSNGVAQKLQKDDTIEWRMLRGKSEDAISFVLGGDFLMHLALFRHGVGCLTVSARPLSNALGDWLAFLHDFRFMQHRNGVRVCAYREAVAFSPLGISAAAGDQSLGFMELVGAVLTASGLKPIPVFTPGHTLPYACLFVRGVADADKAAILHKVRSFFGPKQGDNASSEDLSPTHPAQFAYARDQYFVQTLNGGSFLSFDGESAPLDAFQKHGLPGHLRGIYFCANVLVLYQRFALARLSELVAAKALDDDRDTAWEDIRDKLLDFTARGYFTQAMQSDHHHRYYRKWQEVLQIGTLYAEVRDEVSDLHERATMKLRKRDEDRERAEERRESRFEKTLTILGALFILPSLVLSFLGVNIRGLTCGEEGLTAAHVGVVVVTSMVAGGMLTWLLTRWVGRLGDHGEHPHKDSDADIA